VAAADGDGRHVGDGLGIEGALARTGIERAGRRLHQVIALARLVIDAIDDAERTGAETVLRRGIGEAARDGADIQQPAILALHLVERAAVARGEDAHGRMRRDARRSGRRIDIADRLGTGLRAAGRGQRRRSAA
jgi:hypothetical protein